MGLYDLRRGSPTMGQSALVELNAERTVPADESTHLPGPTSATGGQATARRYPTCRVSLPERRLRNRSAGCSVQDPMEMLLAVLLVLMIPGLLTYLPPDV
jgi:hypothetical protein